VHKVCNGAIGFAIHCLIYHVQSETLKCIAMFAANAARDLVTLHLNDIGNAMNISLDAHEAYDNLEWGIEAREKDGEVRSG
jgi:hypothetical protein